MLFQRIYNQNLSIYTYMIGDQELKSCVVIDPSIIIAPIIEIAKEWGVQITDILETHVHADFVSGALELKNYYEGKPLIYSSTMGGKEWIPSYADVGVVEGTEVRLGEVILKAMHTPGHTPEHVIWVAFDESRSSDVPWFCFTGDLLFVGGVGRPDLLGDMMFKVLSAELYKTLFTRLRKLPDFMEIFPSHGMGSMCGKNIGQRASSTLGYERLFNPAFQEKNLDAFVIELQKGMPTAPAYFKNVKKINVEGPKLMSEIHRSLQKFSLEKFAELKNSSYVIDTRQPEIFARCHVKDSINIPSGGSFCGWAGMVVPHDQPLILIVENEEIILETVEQLSLVGLTDIAGFIVWDRNIHQEMDNLELLPPRQAKLANDLFIIDVRTPAEWNHGHIISAHHMELSRFKDLIKDVPRNQKIATICGSGFRASIAASILQKNGYEDVANIQGGMQAWRQANLPVITDTL